MHIHFIFLALDAPLNAQTFVSQRQNESTPPQMFDSSSNQIIFHGLSSHIDLFPRLIVASLETRIYLILPQSSRPS